MRVLVTGGAGFIGSHVVDRLLNQGHSPVVLDNLDAQVHRPEASRPSHLTADVELIRGDVRDPAAVDLALEGAEAVVHLAAAVGVGQSMYLPHYYTSNNVDGQGVLMEAMAREPGRWRRFVVASSMSIYGEGAYVCERHGALAPEPRQERELARGEWEPACSECGVAAQPALTNEDKPLQYTSVYAITKKTQEELALCFGAAYGVPTLALRFFNVFGSRQALSNPYTGAAAIFLSRLKNGNAPMVFEDGRQARDFVHVHDVADAVTKALEADPAVSGPLNVCTGRPVAIHELATVLAERLGVAIEPDVIGRYRVGDIRHCVGDPSRARQLLGFEAATSFADGLDELISWAERQSAEDRIDAGLAELERQRLVR